MKIARLLFIGGMCLAGITHVGHITGYIRSIFPWLIYAMEAMVIGIGAMLLFGKEKDN